LEHSIRWRNQLLFWTLPEFQHNGTGDNWSTLVTLAQWQLYLARDCVPDQPLPWQTLQQHLTPRRVQQGIGGLFFKIGTPVAPQKLGESRRGGLQASLDDNASLNRWSKRVILDRKTLILA
jgi:hypothetical protein